MAYITVSGEGRAEILIKKSRFIASVGVARSETEAHAFIHRIRSEHREATHNVYAFKAGSTQRMSDDGEPSGTAGRPVFDVLDKQGLSETVIVVTRYFGGVLLGAGGLVHAYSQAAVAGIEAAGTVRALAALDLRLTLEYPLVGKVQHLLQQKGALTLDAVYGADVIITCRIRQELLPELAGELAEASAGRIQVERLRELQVGTDLHPLHELLP